MEPGRRDRFHSPRERGAGFVLGGSQCLLLIERGVGVCC